MDYKIWITYHRDELVEKYGLKEDAHHVLFASHKDADGKYINALNPLYSEMVTMWYVWKNSLKSGYVGFNHYRRQFDVKRLPGKGECQVYAVRDFGRQTLYEQYAQWHNAKDMDVMLSLLTKKYGEDNDYVKHITKGHSILSNCCFLMKWGDFVRLCKFLFPLLDAFRDEVIAPNPTGDAEEELKLWRAKAEKDFVGKQTEYQMRVLSFLSERLISAWIATNMDWYVGGRDVAIVHYNTPELTEAAIMSLRKRTPGCRVFVFDNSDRRPFKAKLPCVTVFDNRRGQLVDFDKALEAYPDKWERDVKKSNYGSAKHAMSVDKLLELLPDGFVLMDSDVLVTRDIAPFWDLRSACAGGIQVKANVPLLMPFLCWLNAPFLRENGIVYFNGDKMWALSDKEPNCHYDTGAWLYEEVRRKRLPLHEFNIWDYVKHFGHGSWRGNEERVERWLTENESLWK